MYNFSLEYRYNELFSIGVNIFIRKNILEEFISILTIYKFINDII